VKTVHETRPVAGQGQITLDEVRAWPPTVDVDEASRALGISKGHIYNSIKRGQFPIKIIRIGSRTKIVTASLITFLEGK
jgi:predicted DNA-binding transcriptional regulator AlpA